MTDLQKFKLLFSRNQIDVPTSDWDIDPSMNNEDDHPDAVHVLVFGCPDGNGAYLQAEFDSRGKLLIANIINPGGYPCDCKHCGTCPTCGQRRRGR